MIIIKIKNKHVFRLWLIPRDNTFKLKVAIDYQSLLGATGPNNKGGQGDGGEVGARSQLSWNHSPCLPF